MMRAKEESSLIGELDEVRTEVREFVEHDVAPFADEWDQAQALPDRVVAALGANGWLGGVVPARYGGSELSMSNFGVLCEEIGRGCSSLRSVLTVHSMVCRSIVRWGRPEQREALLPGMTNGERVGAFAISESGAGSDLTGIETTAAPEGDGYRLSGTKRWCTYGERADLYLVLAQSSGGPLALLVERDWPGLKVEPVRGVLGTSAAMMASIRFDDCFVPKSHVIGRPGFGFSHVIADALDNGRFSVGNGCVGIAAQALELSKRRSNEREQFGQRIGEHQLVQRRLANMAVAVRGARLMCENAARLRDSRSRHAVVETTMAKYAASLAATRCASHAVQIHGAYGCMPESGVGRLFRDARVMEIIEGSTEMQQIMIARHELAH